MNELEVARRLVKSPPELWSACSDPDVLARHLQAFGEIRIVRLEPETTVAWEGESACGTVVLEPSGWGTKVTLTAGVDSEPTAVGSPAPVEETPLQEAPVAYAPAQEMPAGAQAAGPGLLGFVHRLIGKLPASGSHLAVPDLAEPESAAPKLGPSLPDADAGWPEPPESVPDTLSALESALDSLGKAHHRPFSRD